MTQSKDKPKKAVIYARTGTFTADHEPNSLAYQIDLDRQYCASQGYEVVLTLKEVAPGATLQRGEFAKLRQAMEQYTFDVIVVSTFDRISDVESIVQAFIIEAEGKGFLVESVREPTIDMLEEIFF